MNPAQLLNPKAFAKQKKAEQQKSGSSRQGLQQAAMDGSNGWSYDPNWSYPNGYPSLPTVHEPNIPYDAQYHIPQQDPYLMQQYTGSTNGQYGQQQQASNQLPPQTYTPQTFDPRTLLNPRAAVASPSNNDDQLSANAKAGEGMGGLIERMHNVQNREAQSSRKRKVEVADEDKEQHKKSTFSMNGSRNGGMIGEHLRKEREKIASSAGPPPIDLTGEDEEEEVFVVEERSKPVATNEEIILGQFNTKSMVHRVPDVSERARAAVGAGFWPRLRVNWRFPSGVNSNNVIELVTKSGMFFGKIDFKAAVALVPLLKSSVGCNITIIVESRAKKSTEQSGAQVSMQLPIICVLYAPRSKAAAIGKHLSQRQIFLSQPTALGGLHKEYDNPQLPKDYRPDQSSAQRKHQLQGNTIAVTSRTVEEMRRDTTQLFDSLVKHEDLPEKDVDGSLISTPLLPHQKQALHFLTDHEDPDQCGPTLWKEDRNGKGVDFWYNVVTGHQLNAKPAPLLGGILADMMGLGKTLSILSLVATTIGEARAFGQEAVPGDLSCERNARATLIICPKSVMANWSEQIKAHTVENKIRVYSYHGQNRIQDVNELAKCHVVLTTYNTAAAEFNQKNKALAAINWFRIVLDEAHSIRNQNTVVFKACVALHAQRRWAVTGTPVQNGLNDLGALIKFLRVKPFDEGPSWAQYIMAPFKLANTDVVQHLRLLVDSITLRRVKDTINLPDKSMVVCRLEHTAEEQKWYAKVAGESNKKLKVMSANNALKGKSYAHVLKSIGTLRMLCAHGLDMFSEEDRNEIKSGADAANAIDLGDEPEFEDGYTFITERNAYENLVMMSDSDVDRCSKCDRKLIPIKDEDEDEEQSDSSDEEEDTLGYLTPCLHLICPHCKDEHVKEIQPLLEADHHHHCQYCDSYIRYGLFELVTSEFNSFMDARSANIKTPKGRKWDESSYSGPHTKVRALLEELRASAKETADLPEGEPPIRSVVFSGWTSYLDLIEVALDAEDMGYLRLDGKMSVRARTQVLSEFKTDPTKTILLVSIKAGGQGLNFTAANKVYMMEPQFNPGVEEQAVDRVHRLGQTRNVFVKSFIMTGTIEEGILKLQDKKKSLAELSMNRKMSAQQVRKENLEALKDLFK